LRLGWFVSEPERWTELQSRGNIDHSRVMRIESWTHRLFIAALAYLPGCAFLPVPDFRTPADHAREVVPRCRSFSEDASQQLLAPSLIESVEPSYSYVSSNSIDREARLRGARMHLRPTGAMSHESIQRSLECHQAHVVLGLAPARDDDPYVLTGTWLEINADSEGDGFVVAVQTMNFETARSVLERARRFAAAKQ
jgi:hypothetical protein